VIAPEILPPVAPQDEAATKKRKMPTKIERRRRRRVVGVFREVRKSAMNLEKILWIVATDIFPLASKKTSEDTSAFCE
jgi:hypothetical protein